MTGRVRNRIASLVVISATALIIAVGCTDPATVKGPATRINQAAVVAIQSQISADPRMSGASITVNGDRDAVILSGKAVSADQIKTAEELALKYDPDLKIENKIKVDPAAANNSPVEGY